jgi:hypothetical protein
MISHDDPSPSSQEYFSRASRGKDEKRKQEKKDRKDLHDLQLHMLQEEAEKTKKKEKRVGGPHVTPEALEKEQERQDAKNAQAPEEFPTERTT